MQCLVSETNLASQHVSAQTIVAVILRTINLIFSPLLRLRPVVAQDVFAAGL